MIMKAILTADCKINGESFVKGTTLEVNQNLLISLVKAGCAKKIEDATVSDTPKSKGKKKEKSKTIKSPKDRMIESPVTK